MQNTFSQNKEDLFVLDYFGDYKGTLLSIGENDGITFSNSRLLIENGWGAILVEPGIAGDDLHDLYFNNSKVSVFRFGIGSKHDTIRFWESGSHVENGTDRGLVSTTDFEETKRWPNVTFVEKDIIVLPFCAFEKDGPFDFISLDTEGNDWKILQQIDLEKVGCKCLCIEWNSKPELFRLFRDYCGKFGLFCVHQNAENLIFTV
jgi:hypothetical protein